MLKTVLRFSCEMYWMIILHTQSFYCCSFKKERGGGGGRGGICTPVLQNWPWWHSSAVYVCCQRCPPKDYGPIFVMLRGRVCLLQGCCVYDWLNLVTSFCIWKDLSVVLALCALCLPNPTGGILSDGQVDQDEQCCTSIKLRFVPVHKCIQLEITEWAPLQFQTFWKLSGTYLGHPLAFQADFSATARYHRPLKKHKTAFVLKKQTRISLRRTVTGNKSTSLGRCLNGLFLIKKNDNYVSVFKKTECGAFSTVLNIVEWTQLMAECMLDVDLDKSSLVWLESLSFGCLSLMLFSSGTCLSVPARDLACCLQG